MIGNFIRTIFQKIFKKQNFYKKIIDLKVYDDVLIFNKKDNHYYNAWVMSTNNNKITVCYQKNDLQEDEFVIENLLQDKIENDKMILFVNFTNKNINHGTCNL